MLSLKRVFLIALALTATSVSAKEKKSDGSAPAAAAPIRSASITPGHYSDSSGGHELFIKEVIEDGFATYYAAIIWKAGFISIYRIEDVDGATQAWINIYQSTSNNIATNDVQTATYAVTPLQMNGRLSLRFVWTDYASKIGSNVPCSIVPNFVYKGQGTAWGDFSVAIPGRYNGKRARVKPAAKAADKQKLDSKTELIMTRIPETNDWNVIATNMIIETLNYKPWLNKAVSKEQQPEQTIYNGDYRGTELLPGLMLMKRKQLDSMSTAGVSLSNEVSMFALPIVTGTKNKSVESVYVIRMAPGDVECAYVRSQIKLK